MKIREIFDKAIKFGIELDPRGTDEVHKALTRTKNDFENMNKREKETFDIASLTNPYADSRVLCGDPEKEVKKVLVGIDIEVGEIVLADRLRDKGNEIDLIIAHHPEGRAMAALYDVMGMQAGILMKYGVPINVAEDLLDERIKEVERRLLPVNHSRAVDAARLLNIPLICIHTPTDNAVTENLQQLFTDKKPDRISDILDLLMEIPEYKGATKERAGPRVVVGSKERRAGKVFVDMTGGTGGSKKAFEKLSQAGVGTVVGMHIGEEHRKEAQKHHVNVVIAGHISSDTLGINLLLDRILEDIEVVSCSGFRRISRKQ